MKRAAFLSFDWDHEVMSSYYEGIRSYLDERDDTALFVFNAYGENEGLEAGTWALDLFSLCDIDRYDGFLVQGNRTWAPEERQHLVDRMRSLGKPVVSVSYGLEGACYVGIDNYGAEYGLVCTVILDQGCKRPAFVCGLETSLEAQERLRGFLDACRDCGIEDVQVFEGSWLMEDGVKAAQKMLEAPDRLPDVVFCCNDELAAGVLKTLMQQGVRVPDDVRITGFDNSDLARVVVPHVTTVDRDYTVVGRTAIETLVALMNGETLLPHVYSPVSYVLTESAGYPYDPRYAEGLAAYLSDMNRSLRRFLRLLAPLQPALLGAQTMQEMVAVMGHYLSSIDCPNSCLLFNDAFFESDGWARHLPYGDTMSLVACEGENLTELAGDACADVRLSASEVVPPQLASIPTLFMVLPMRHEGTCIGTMVTQGVPRVYRYGFVPVVLTLFAGFIESAHRREVLERANSLLDDLYVHDQLTGLFNRFGLQRYGVVAYEHLLRDFEEAHFIFVDIDDMKLINDRYGHEEGDRSICDTAEVINRSIVGENAFAMRYGGDEFLLICRRNLIPRLEEELVRLKERCVRPYDLSLSMGDTHVMVDDRLSLEVAIERADACMYEVKKARKAGRR